MQTYFILLCLLASCLAHICILNPPQRGNNMMIAGPLAAACGNTLYPCAIPDPAVGQLPTTSIMAGTMFNVTILKNVNYYDPNAVGKFIFTYRSLMHPEVFPGPVTLFATMDVNTVSGSLFFAGVHLPKYQDRGVLGVEYHATSISTVFYGCSDIMLM